MQVGGLSLGLEGEAKKISSYTFVDLLWYALLGMCGGVLGASYTAVVMKLAALRQRFLPPLTPLDTYDAGSSYVKRAWLRYRGQWCRMVEVAAFSLVVFSLFYWVPFVLSCTPCQEGISCPHSYHGSQHATHHSNASGHGASARGRALESAGVRVHLVYLQYGCPAGQISPSASLLHTGQEGLVMQHTL